MAIYEVTILGTYLSQQIVNRLNFVSDINVTDTSAVNLGRALGYNAATPTLPTALSVLARFCLAQTTTYVLTGLMFRDIYSVIDFYSVATSGANWAGTLASGTTANLSFVTQKIRTNRVRTDIKAGTLALTPPLENAADSQGNLDGATLTLLGNLCTALNLPPAYVGTDTVNFRPAVCSKQAYFPDPEDETKVAYRYWPTHDEQIAHTAVPVTWSAVGRLSSQTSRRIGNGR
jgi:hypothetical protein